jgi:putative hydrolase of HD superfamily
MVRQMKTKKKENYLEFFETINRLKEIKRTGWIIVGVKNPESVAEHSFRTAIMAFFLAKRLKCNKEKLVKICLLHDLHESICGDLILDYTSYYPEAKGLGKKEKAKQEKKAFEELTQIIGQGDSKEFSSLWKELERQKTREAKAAKELDVLEMLLQAAEYEKTKNFEKPIWKPWLERNRKRIKNRELKKILEELEKQMI